MSDGSAAYFREKPNFGLSYERSYYIVFFAPLLRMYKLLAIAPPHTLFKKPPPSLVRAHYVNGS